MKSVTTPPWATWGKGTWVQVVTTRVGWGGVGLFVQFLAKKKKMKLQRKICVCWEWGDELSYSFNMFT